EYSVTAINPSGLKPVMLPIADDALKLYLAPAPYLEGTDVDLVAQTKKLVGSDKNAASVVQKLRTWVFQNMTPDYTIGVPRSSGEIFHKRRGVCRDYAALFAGMARVAGVPTRLVGGIVFGDGKFYYHAWAECWLGEWVPVDPTLNMEVVDATHVKFAQGDVTDMYRVANIVGKLKIEIIESR
ncbi:MAG: transglutaminase-like domain-containing protein, partial [Chthonomonadales bacterium]